MAGRGRPKKANGSNGGANLGFESKRGLAADELRGQSRTRVLIMSGSILAVAGLVLLLLHVVSATTILVVVSSTFILLYAPLAILQLVFINRNGKWVTEASRAGRNLPVAAGRRVLSIITTAGQSPDVVEKIIATLRSYRMPGPFEVRVLVEEGDPFPYSAERTIVPASFATPLGSRLKMRALHFGALWLRENGYGSETYVLHLDDDSVPTEGYVDYLFRMTEPCGQGNVRLREHGRHLFSTLADFVRIGDCDAWCSHFNRKGRPMAVHGEGLVIRADVESTLGWDFGTYGADDFLMGQALVRAGYHFTCIPHEIYIAPPTSARDFYLQRRRWLISILWARREVRALRPAAWRWVLYRYLVGWTGFFGVGLMIWALAVHLPVPLPLQALGLFNLVSYLVFYQYGAWHVNWRRYWWRMLLFQIPVALYEGGTLFWSLLQPPDRRFFDVIQKV